jgi:hypothetical protein
MKNRYMVGFGAILALVVLSNVGLAGWFDPPGPSTPQSSSGLIMQHVALGPVKEGMSLEQYNVYQRYIHDNKADALKYVYLLGPNGQITMNFQIVGKVTSSGKRLTPRTVAAYAGEYSRASGMDVTIAGKTYETNEVIEDDGTFGDSIPYTYMWTTAGNYVQVIPMGTFLEIVADKQLTPTELTFSVAAVKN